MPETPVFSAAAVAAPHTLAAEAGRAILTEGGNALEATVAMAATIAVAYPHMNAVAGAVGGWQAALDYARSLGAKIPLSVLLSDAVRLAREGCPVSLSEAHGV